MQAKLGDLPYAYDALEPYIDARTMEIHHSKHHATYVQNFNKAVDGRTDLEGETIEQLLVGHKSVPAEIRQAVINHGGGHLNHSLFWDIMAARAGGEPTGELATAINGTFGSFETLKEQFTKAAITRFGSGWAWLCLAPSDGLLISSTANQDSPLMSGAIPILGLDVWEHAYYLKYQNRRPEYVEAWWNVVNWEAVGKRFKEAQSAESKQLIGSA